MNRFFLNISYFLFLSLIPSIAFADEIKPWQLGFHEPASPVMQKLVDFHDFLLIIITFISLFVLGLLAYVCYRFSEDRNPIPSNVTHNTTLEIIWSVIPVLILIIIAIPSFKILYYMDKVPNAEMTLKVTGYQWYWGYEYPDNGNLAFESYIIPEDKLKPGQLRLLEVDNRVVLPVDTNIRILLTSSDVIHAWGVPAFGVKIDATPGRLNETWVRINKPGIYRGQCSELCGPYHGFMPIVIEAVSKEKFYEWVNSKKKVAANDNDQQKRNFVASN